MKNSKVYRSELTPLTFLRRSAYVYPEKIAVVHKGVRYTYREFEERVNRLTSVLLNYGLKKHDRVAFLSPNTPALLEAHFAVPAVGGILAAINTRLSSGEIEYILNHSGSRLLFVDEELHPLLKTLDLKHLEVIQIKDSGSLADPYEKLLSEGSPEPVEQLLENEEEPISINYTSGTTGRPKGVVYTHRGAYLNSLGSIIETGMNVESVFLWTLPMFHCNGWCFTWAVTAVAGTHVCLRKVDPELIWKLIKNENVTHFNGAPTVYAMVVNSPQANRLENPVTVNVAAAPPSPTLFKNLKKLNFRPIHLYGLTETYGPITVCAWHKEWDDLPIEEQALAQSRQGQGYITADLVRVVDKNDNDVPRDGTTIGEVVMRGNNVMKGYYRQRRATSEAFREGWFHSGDLGVWHSDGYIELRDRKKDIIISGGENISTIEVEQTIVKHPDVLECAVIAIPDEKWGERPKAFVTLKEGRVVSEKELISFCRENLAHFKCPAAVEFCELPKTSTGKVQKYILREKEWGDIEKRIN
ncbi:acyl--CoA ligase family protein [Desulfobacterota bacterium AH_259_B03_O07]|nr:acyl--CoA ligase family protein [Desulfobacterota bacterium AH_259_B03_O07]